MAPTRAEAFRYWLKLGFVSFGGPAYTFGFGGTTQTPRRIDELSVQALRRRHGPHEARHGGD